tara:strand:- start:13142 stop:13507 length:366 start_codon:yes stop_codon:yes gene_type:complete
MVWTKSSEGIFFGVCQGLGESFDLNPWLLRFLLLFAIFFLGTGFLIYICLALTLPSKERAMEAKEAKILGVCYRLSRHGNIEVGLLRFLFLFFALLSGGLVLVLYVVLHFILKPVDDDIVI